MISSKFFVDSNVFLYLPDNNAAKKDIAEKLLAQLPNINSQVLVEVANVCKKRFGYTKSDLLLLWTGILNSCTCLPIDKTTIATSIYLTKKYDFQLFDAIIVAGALEGNYSVLYSEDLQNNQVIEDRLTIKNPFLISHILFK